MKKLYIPPTLIAYSILIMTLLYLYIPQLNLIRFPFNLIGFFVAFSGFFLMGKARDLFKKHQTTLKIKQSTYLITEGVFAKTRNPMYLGMTLFIFGLSILSSNALALLLAFIFMTIVRLVFISKEERLMLDAFGEEYTEYKKEVSRWI